MARVLLVDDDIAEISVVKRVLARAGHQPVLVTNGAGALASVAQTRPDLLVVSATCDSGGALRCVTGDDAARGLPLLVLGETTDAPATQLSRPVDPEQLAYQVTAALAAAAGVAVPPSLAPRRTPIGRAVTPSRPAPAAPAPDRAAGTATRRAPPARPGVPAPLPGARAPSLEAGKIPAPRRVANGATGDRGPARRGAAAELVAPGAARRRPAAPPAAAPPPAAPPPADEPDEADLALEALLGPTRDDDPDVDAILRRAEEAERGRAAERKARVRQADRATVEAAQRAEAERVVIEKAARARAAEAKAQTEERARAAAEEKARAEERARAAAEKKARAEEQARAAAEKKARAEEDARAAAERKARAEESARAAAERKARAEAAARARTEEEARARAELERRAAAERVGAETDARRRLEEELQRLREQVEAERRTAEEKIQQIMKRAAAEEAAAEGLRRLAEEEAERKRHSEEEDLRIAISSARAEMEELRRRSEEEARRRAEAEAEVERLAREAERRAAEAAALPAPLGVPVYQPLADDPSPDPAEASARRRVAALRERIAADPNRGDDAGDPAARAVRTAPPELRAGTLEDLPAPRLLALAALSEATGRIDLEGEHTRSIWFERGRIVGASSGDPADRVEEVALRLGLVTRDQHDQIAAAAASLSSRRTALLLVERGFVKPTELTALVRRRTEEVVFGAFSETAARFRWAAGEISDDERIALERSTLALAVEGVRRRWLAERVDAVLGGAGTLLAPVATGPSPDALELSPKERRAVALADGLRTLDEIVAASPLDPLSTRQVLVALVFVGSLAARAFEGGHAAAAAAEAIDLARVREKLEHARRADYFTVLGVSRVCTPHEVREAAARLAAEFDPRRYEGAREEGLEARLKEIRNVIDDAREILADDGLRAEYLRGLPE